MNRRASAGDAVAAALARVAATDARVNAFTAVLEARARGRADFIDNDPAQRALPLAGVPFAVKNLFDIEGVVTLAGSKIERDAAPARADAVVVRRLEAAGAVLVGALNMDEYAYGFTTENSHVGPTRNPHDPERLAGGSSGGSAAAVAAGQVPISVGTDTNGSIRVPASLCGVWGLKPTYGRLSRRGSYPFAASLDHVGPFARSVAEVAAAYDAMQGPDDADPACAQRPVEAVVPRLGKGVADIRIGVLGGWFRTMALGEATAAVDTVAAALGAREQVEWPEVERARAAAFLITNAEGANLHLRDLRTRAADFEPLSRDRFLAGALLPANWIVQAQRLRHWFARRVAASFATVDVLIAPATPCIAPAIGTEWLEIAGRRLPARASLGLLTQPVSCIGLPVLTAPLFGMRADLPHLPIGVQLIAAPWREDLCLRVGAELERRGVCSARIAPGGRMTIAASEIDLPDVHAEVAAAFARYEQALVGNDVAVLDELFWDSARTVRYGVAENLVGIEAIRAFRAARPAAGLARTLAHTVITTFGRDAATAMTEFRRVGSDRIGRQSQTWVRTEAGWRVVAAHVSLMPAESAPAARP